MGVILNGHIQDYDERQTAAFPVPDNIWKDSTWVDRHLDTSLPLLLPLVRYLEILFRLEHLRISQLHSADEILPEKLKKTRLIDHCAVRIP